MIRQARAEDTPAIVDMALEFWGHTQFSNEEFDPVHVAMMADHCREEGVSVVYDSNGVQGFACAVIGPLLASPDVMQGSEVAYWINPKHRGKGIFLLRELESQAKNKGCKYFTMISMQSSSPETANKIYRREGYDHTETAFTKRL